MGEVVDFWKGESSETISLGDMVDECVEVVDVNFTEGRYGAMAIITDADGVHYRTSSTVLMDNLRKIMEYLQNHPNTKGVAVKVEKRKNYYVFGDCDEKPKEGFVSWSTVNPTSNIDLSEIPRLEAGMTITIFNATKYTGKYGDYWIIETDKGLYRTSSTVLGKNLNDIVNFLEQHPDVDGVRVKVKKKKNYYVFVNPEE